MLYVLNMPTMPPVPSLVGGDCGVGSAGCLQGRLRHTRPASSPTRMHSDTTQRNPPLLSRSVGLHAVCVMSEAQRGVCRLSVCHSHPRVGSVPFSAGRMLAPLDRLHSGRVRALRHTRTACMLSHAPLHLWAVTSHRLHTPSHLTHLLGLLAAGIAAAAAGCCLGLAFACGSQPTRTPCVGLAACKSFRLTYRTALSSVVTYLVPLVHVPVCPY
jgi:hypothetical protein